MYFDLMDLFFDNSVYWFHRPLKDMSPYTYQIIEGKGQLILNTLGVSPDDISVEVKASPNGDNYQALTISGKTKKLEKEYSVNMTFQIKNKIKAIDWESSDGVTVLSISFEEPLQPNVAISRK